VIAYVSVKVDPGKEYDVAQEIGKIDGIAEAALTYGFSDILLKVNVESIEALNELVFNKIRKIQGIKDTQTVIVSEYLL